MASSRRRRHGTGPTPSVRRRRAARHPHRRRVARQPRPASAGPCSSTPTRPDAFDPDAPAGRRRRPGPRASAPTTSPSTRASCWPSARRRRLGARGVDLRLDSKLIVEQLNGRWRVKDAKLQGLFAEARSGTWRASRAGPRSTSRARGTGPPTPSPTWPSTIRTRQRRWWPRSRGATVASRRRYPKSSTSV